MFPWKKCSPAAKPYAQVVLEPETRQSGRVVTITREDVFVELGGREQGIIPLRLFTAEPPQPGAELDVIVVRYNPEDGLYELTLPNVAASVGDWSQFPRACWWKPA